MSFVFVTPELLGSAAKELAGVESSLSQIASAAIGPTTGMATAAADEVSEAIAALFNGHGQAFLDVSAQASAYHDQFVRTLSVSSNAFGTAEAASADQLLLKVLNAPTDMLLGRPLIGSGADGTAVNPNGSAGGFLYSLSVGGERWLRRHAC